MLIGAIGVPALRRVLQTEHRMVAHEEEMRNSQLAVLCGVILAGALVVAVDRGGVTEIGAPELLGLVLQMLSDQRDLLDVLGCIRSHRLPAPVGQFGEDMGGAVQVERHDLAAGLRDLRLSDRQVIARGIGGTAGSSREKDSECGAGNRYGDSWSLR